MTALKFPHLIKEGSSVVKIYRTPVRSGGSKKGVRSAKKTYAAFTVVYKFGGKRMRKVFADFAMAKAEARTAATKINNGQMETSQLSPEEFREFHTGRQILSELKGIKIDQALMEFAEAKKALRGGSLVQAAQFFTRYGADKIRVITVPDAASALVTSLEKAKLGDYHIDTTRDRITKFAKAFTGNISDVTTSDIEKWLGNLGPGARTQNNYRATVVQLFNFAQKKLNALPHWLPHAAEGVTRIKEPVKDTELYSCEEMEKILKAASPAMVPLLAIRAFSGIRNEELFKLTWDQIDFEAGYLKLKKATTKLRARRIIPLLPNLRAWLSGHAKKEGFVHMGYSSAKTLSDAVSNAIRDAKVPVKRNALRNCYTSYRLAILGDIARVAEETGNSPKVIREEYLELVMPDVAKKWFQLSPVTA